MSAKSRSAISAAAEEQFIELGHPQLHPGGPSVIALT